MSYQAQQYKKGWDTGVIKKGGLASRLAAFESFAKPKGDTSAAKGGITDPNILERIRAAKKAAAAGNVTTPKTPLKSWDNKVKGTPPSFKPENQEKENKPEEKKPEEKPAEPEPAKNEEKPEEKPAETEPGKLKIEEKPAETEEEAKLRAEKEAKAKEEAETKAKEEAEAKAAKAKEEAEAKAKAEAEAKVKAEEDAKKSKAAIRIQAKMRSVLTRLRVMKMIDQMIEDLKKKKVDNEKKFEEDKKKWEEEQERRKVKLEEERKVSRQSLAAVGKMEITEGGWGWGFVGPLQLPIARIPHWWMDESPHKTLFSEDFDDKEEEHWKYRQSHLEQFKKEQEPESAKPAPSQPPAPPAPAPAQETSAPATETPKVENEEVVEELVEISDFTDSEVYISDHTPEPLQEVAS